MYNKSDLHCILVYINCVMVRFIKVQDIDKVGFVNWRMGHITVEQLSPFDHVIDMEADDKLDEILGSYSPG